jgi:hypothetical protein
MRAQAFLCTARGNVCNASLFAASAASAASRAGVAGETSTQRTSLCAAEEPPSAGPLATDTLRLRRRLALSASTRGSGLSAREPCCCPVTLAVTRPRTGGNSLELSMIAGCPEWSSKPELLSNVERAGAQSGRSADPVEPLTQLLEDAEQELCPRVPGNSVSCTTGRIGLPWLPSRNGCMMQNT